MNGIIKSFLNNYYKFGNLLLRSSLVSIPVRDQEEALQFYTDKLDFLKKKDEPLGGGSRWLTLVAKDWQDGPELLLEPAPNHFEPSKVYQNALKDAGIPWTHSTSMT